VEVKVGVLIYVAKLVPSMVVCSTHASVGSYSL